MSNFKIVQVIPAPFGLFNKFKNDDGSFHYEPVRFLGLLEDEYQDKALYAVQPLANFDYGFIVAEEIHNHYGMVDIWDVISGKLQYYASKVFHFFKKRVGFNIK